MDRWEVENRRGSSTGTSSDEALLGSVAQGKAGLSCITTTCQWEGQAEAGGAEEQARRVIPISNKVPG